MRNHVRNDNGNVSRATGRLAHVAFPSAHPSGTSAFIILPSSFPPSPSLRLRRPGSLICNILKKFRIYQVAMATVSTFRMRKAALARPWWRMCSCTCGVRVQAFAAIANPRDVPVVRGPLFTFALSVVRFSLCISDPPHPLRCGYAALGVAVPPRWGDKNSKEHSAADSGATAALAVPERQSVSRSSSMVGSSLTFLMPKWTRNSSVVRKSLGRPGVSATPTTLMRRFSWRMSKA